MIKAMTNSICIFCVTNQNTPISNDPTDRVIKEYQNWWLVLQPEAKRQKTKQAAGMLIVKRHVAVPSRLSAEEATELFTIYKDASQTLCNHVGMAATEIYVVKVPVASIINSNTDNFFGLEEDEYLIADYVLPNEVVARFPRDATEEIYKYMHNQLGVSEEDLKVRSNVTPTMHS